MLRIRGREVDMCVSYSAGRFEAWASGFLMRIFFFFQQKKMFVLVDLTCRRTKEYKTEICVNIINGIRVSYGWRG